MPEIEMVGLGNEENMIRGFSMIVCTRNRSTSLRRCLAAIPVAEMLESQGELIVVNNASTDETRQLLASFRRDAPFPVTVVDEPRPGLGRARNTGVAKASGEVLFFTDDDCYVAPGTIRKARTIFASKAFLYCGGQLLVYDPTDAGYGFNTNDQLELIPPYSFLPAGRISGALMVIHRLVFDTIGGFDPCAGPGASFCFDDVDFCARASMAGFAGAFVPDLIVYHHHGRKEGDEIERLKERDDYGRGAYYAKLTLMGRLSYVRYWGYYALYLHPRSKTMREVRGALGYACARIFRSAEMK